MSSKTHSITLRVEPDLRARIEAYREKYGTPYSEQLRRALLSWLESVEGPSTARKRVAARKRA